MRTLSLIKSEIGWNKQDAVCVCVRVCVYTNTMDYYSVIKKKNKLMLFAATWMAVEIIIPSKVSQRQTSRDIIYT